MAVTPKKLYQGELINSVQLVYAAVGNKTIVKNILIIKQAKEEGLIDLYFVASGKTENDSMKIISNYEVTSPLLSIDISLVMENGDSIKAINKGTGKVNLYVSGVEVV